MLNSTLSARLVFAVENTKLL